MAERLPSTRANLASLYDTKGHEVAPGDLIRIKSYYTVTLKESLNNEDLKKHFERHRIDVLKDDRFEVWTGESKAIYYGNLDLDQLASVRADPNVEKVDMREVSELYTTSQQHHQPPSGPAPPLPGPLPPSPKQTRPYPPGDQQRPHPPSGPMPPPLPQRLRPPIQIPNPHFPYIASYGPQALPSRRVVFEDDEPPVLSVTLIPDLDHIHEQPDPRFWKLKEDDWGLR